MAAGDNYRKASALLLRRKVALLGGLVLFSLSLSGHLEGSPLQAALKCPVAFEASMTMEL